MMLPSYCSEFPWLSVRAEFCCTGSFPQSAPFVGVTVEGRPSGDKVEEAMTITVVDALSDVITSINAVYLMPELRKGFHTLFTFKYMEIYIYHTFMLSGSKPNTVFISLVHQML